MGVTPHYGQRLVSMDIIVIINAGKIFSQNFPGENQNYLWKVINSEVLEANQRVYLENSPI